MGQLQRNEEALLAILKCFERQKTALTMTQGRKAKLRKISLEVYNQTESSQTLMFKEFYFIKLSESPGDCTVFKLFLRKLIFIVLVIYTRAV